MQEATLLLHFIGMGILAAALIGGIVVNAQYKKAPDLRSKALVLKTGRTLGLFAPIGTLVMIVTGIGNMHAIGAGFSSLRWLSIKIVIFAVMAVLGGILGGLGRKRGALVHAMSIDGAAPDSGARLTTYDRVLGAGYLIMTILFLSVLYLSAIGRLGAV